MAERDARAFPSSRLVYARGDGAEACPSEAVVRQAVARRLGYDPFFPSANKTIIAKIARDRDDLHGRVELVDERGLIQGAREFRLPPGQCDELVATMALAISIAVDPTMDASAIDEPPAPADVPAAPTAQTNVAATKKGPGSRPRELERDRIAAWPTAPPASPPARGLETRAGISATSSFGTAPATALGIAGSFGIFWSRVSLSIEGRHDWASSVGVPGGGTAEASLWSGNLAPCFHWGPWFGCGLGAIGSLHGTGNDLLTSRTGNTLYAAAGGRVGADLRLIGPFFFRPELDVLGNLARVELRVDGRTVWQAPPLSVLVGTGFFIAFR